MTRVAVRRMLEKMRGKKKRTAMTRDPCKMSESYSSVFRPGIRYILASEKKRYILVSARVFAGWMT